MCNICLQYVTLDTLKTHAQHNMHWNEIPTKHLVGSQTTAVQQHYMCTTPDKRN